MAFRLLGLAMKGVETIVSSIENPTVQIVLGTILVVYTSFLESDRESVLSVLMTNPLGRTLVLSFLAILSMASPPIGILFGVLISMSSFRKGGDGSDYWMKVKTEEGFGPVYEGPVNEEEEKNDNDAQNFIESNNYE
jgi:hypothetical protein